MANDKKRAAAVKRFGEIRQEIKKLADEALKIYKSYGENPAWAEAYWHGHINYAIGATEKDYDSMLEALNEMNGKRDDE